MKPYQFKMQLTESFNEIQLPNTIIRLSFKSVEGNEIKIKFNSTDGDEMVLPAKSVWDSGFLSVISDLWQNPAVFVSGVGHIDGEYWR